MALQVGIALFWYLGSLLTTLSAVCEIIIIII